MKNVFCGLSLTLLLAVPLSAQKVGTIVVAHGGDSVWNARVRDAANSANIGGPVEVSFLMGGAAPATRFQDMVARLERAGVSMIVVVPMLVSSYSGHFAQIRYLVRDDAPAPVRTEAVLRIRELIALQHLATGEPVIVVPILVSEGTVNRDRVPNDLHGTPSLYKRTPLLPHPAMVRWIEARVSERSATPAATAR